MQSPSDNDTRVSTQDQDTCVQLAALKAADCDRVFQEKASGGRWEHRKLKELLGQLRNGDVVVVWKLDRLSRSLKDLLLVLEKIDQAGAHFQSLTEAIDTTTSAGRMMMPMVGSVAEFERSLLRERTRVGLDEARPSSEADTCAATGSSQSSEYREKERRQCGPIVPSASSHDVAPVGPASSDTTGSAPHCALY